ncbi:MAG: phosphoribosyltransferase [Candidatus Nitrosocosmicus sp.]|nr:phosphoribosyltransferase [Candidatus Nitrosocosmicus sp.]
MLLSEHNFIICIFSYILIMSTLFEDRNDAAYKLAKEIEGYLKYDQKNVTFSNKDLIVLAIPRGGIILANVIASHFECELDVVVSRKIRHESNEELAIGAVMPDGTFFINERILKILPISRKCLEQEIEFQRKEINRRLMEFRGTTSYADKLNNKIIILVDDGIATGATITASAKWLEKNYSYNKLIIAVPVAPKTSETVDILSTIADKVIVLYSPQDFSAVGQFYQRFDQVSDNEVKEIMRRYHFNI